MSENSARYLKALYHALLSTNLILQLQEIIQKFSKRKSTCNKSMTNHKKFQSLLKIFT